MNKPSIGIYIIASALIWGLVMLGCALSMRGTECYPLMQNILNAGAGIHLIIIWGPLAVQFKKLKEQAGISTEK